MGLLRFLYGSRNDPANADLDAMGQLMVARLLQVVSENGDASLDNGSKPIMDMAVLAGKAIAELQQNMGASDWAVARVLSAMEIAMVQQRVPKQFIKLWLSWVKASHTRFMNDKQPAERTSPPA